MECVYNELIIHLFLSENFKIIEFFLSNHSETDWFINQHSCFVMHVWVDN